MPDFDLIIKRENTQSVKYDLRQTLFGRSDVIPMWVADMDFAMPECVARALRQRIDHGILGYSFRDRNFARALTGWLKRRHGLEVAEESVCFSPGIVSALVVMLEAFTEKGDKILVQPPVYHPFFEVPLQNQRQVIWNELIYDGRQYNIDFDKLSRQLRDVKMVIISHPHNPVSRAWNPEELELLAQLCAENDVLLVSDEIHSDLMLQGYRHTPLLKASPEAAENIITCYAPSKTFNLAGLFTSAIVITNPVLRQKYNSTLERLHMQMGNIMGQVAFEAAYREGEPWLEQLLVYLNRSVEHVKKRIASEYPWLGLAEPQATYLLWLDFRSLNLSADELNEKLVKTCGLGLSRGDQFGPGGAGFMRMNIASPLPLIDKALDKLKLLVS